MAGRKEQGAQGTAGYGQAFDLVLEALEGPTRRDILASAGQGGDGLEALAKLRGGMRAHLFPAGARLLPLKPLVRGFTRRTRAEGFRILHDWDGRAARFSKEIIPVDMLDHGIALARRGMASPKSPAILLDYYFLHVLALFVLRAWDEGDPNENLDRVTEALAALQGEGGSGLRFVSDAESLLWVAVSNYQPHDSAYDQLLEKVRTLDDAHRMRFALVGAGVLGSHLRWGFEAYYDRSVNLLRRDNFADYPWLLFSLATCMEAYHGLQGAGVTGPERHDLVGALLNGLTCDVPAFTEEPPPPALEGCREEHARFSRLFRIHRDELLEEFAAQRPSSVPYSPLAFHFNFPHNALKARLGMALAGEKAPNLPLDALLTGGASDGEEGDERAALAAALTAYGKRNPEHIGKRRVMVLGYSPRTATRCYRALMWAEPGNREASASTERLRTSPFQRGEEPGT